LHCRSHRAKPTQESWDGTPPHSSRGQFCPAIGSFPRFRLGRRGSPPGEFSAWVRFSDFRNADVGSSVSGTHHLQSIIVRSNLGSFPRFRPGLPRLVRARAGSGSHRRARSPERSIGNSCGTSGGWWCKFAEGEPAGAHLRRCVGLVWSLAPPGRGRNRVCVHGPRVADVPKRKGRQPQSRSRPRRDSGNPGGCVGVIGPKQVRRTRRHRPPTSARRWRATRPHRGNGSDIR